LLRELLFCYKYSYFRTSTLILLRELLFCYENSYFVTSTPIFVRELLFCYENSYFVTSTPIFLQELLFCYENSDFLARIVRWLSTFVRPWSDSSSFSFSILLLNKQMGFVKYGYFGHRVYTLWTFI